uniref:GFA family protein n=1 Tax=Litoreibacter roseus TaxID=2601869 RepID=UPI001FAA8474|nr:GFA family protein [Litoreibacter roseus]
MLAEPSMMGTCHCSRCRKVGASAIVFIKKSDLEWVQGKEKLTTFQPAAPYLYSRCFCQICGTSLGEILSDDDTFPISANALDDAFEVRNQFHEFVAEKPSWYEICDAAQQFQGHPTRS